MSQLSRKHRVMNLHRSDYGVCAKLILIAIMSITFCASFHNDYQPRAAVCRSAVSVLQVRVRVTVQGHFLSLDDC